MRPHPSEVSATPCPMLGFEEEGMMEELINALKALRFEVRCAVETPRGPLLMALERAEALLAALPLNDAPKRPHQWKDTYIHGGHYPDGKRCGVCGYFDLPQAPRECPGHPEGIAYREDQPA